eukprot:7390837-Prymnesium_polylepis.2
MPSSSVPAMRMSLASWSLRFLYCHQQRSRCRTYSCNDGQAQPHAGRATRVACKRHVRGD